MKTRYTLFLLCLLAGYVSGHAQQQFRKPLKASSESRSLSGKNYLGVKAGATWSVLSKNDLDKIAYLGHWGYLMGISGEHLFNQFSIGLDACWVQRGTRMRRESTFQVSLNEEGTVNNEITAVYDVASISIPVTFYLSPIQQGRRLTPYLYLAPSVDLPLPYCFRWDDDQHKPVFSEPVLVNTTQISNLSNTSSTQVFSSRLDAGVSAGIGLMMSVSAGGSDLRLKINAGCRQGLINLATDKLKTEGVLVLSQSLEASVTLLFLLKKPLHDACYGFTFQ